MLASLPLIVLILIAVLVPRLALGTPRALAGRTSPLRAPCSRRFMRTSPLRSATMAEPVLAALTRHARAALARLRFTSAPHHTATSASLYAALRITSPARSR